MLAVLYILYVIVRAKLNPKLAPPLSKEDRVVALSAVPAAAATLPQPARPACPDRRTASARRNHGGPQAPDEQGELLIDETALEFTSFVAVHRATTTEPAAVETAGLIEMGGHLIRPRSAVAGQRRPSGTTH